MQEEIRPPRPEERAAFLAIAAEYLPGEASQEFILRFLSRRKRAALSAGDLTIDSISYATVSGGKALCIAFQPANVLGVPVTARLVAVF